MNCEESSSTVLYHLRDVGVLNDMAGEAREDWPGISSDDSSTSPPG